MLHDVAISILRDYDPATDGQVVWVVAGTEQWFAVQAIDPVGLDGGIYGGC